MIHRSGRHIHRVIARFLDGTVLKGHTTDFLPTRGHFHLLPADSCPGTRPTQVRLPDLKGVFFVRHLDGNPAHLKSNAFDPNDVTPGRRIRVVFLDGEVLHGLTMGYRPDRAGFFVMPADQRSNNMRCYVVASSTREVSLL
jgi:hypothetical protein